MLLMHEFIFSDIAKSLTIDTKKRSYILIISGNLYSPTVGKHKM